MHEHFFANQLNTYYDGTEFYFNILVLQLIILFIYFLINFFILCFYFYFIFNFVYFLLMIFIFYF